MTDLINIENREGQLVVSSREVAEHFEKEHKHILRDINEYSPKLGCTQKLFIKSEYTASNGKKNPEYLLTRDGFSLLVMGFTGSKALAWKLKYIEAFNEMEQKIKQFGGFEVPNNLPEALRLAADYAEKVEALESEVSKRDQLIGELKPSADYTDRILQNKGLVTITQIAKDYGMSGKALNKILAELGVQYKQSGQWLLYSKYHAKGYTHSKTIEIQHKDGNSFVKMETKWTQKGRLFLYELLKANDILPVVEEKEVG